MVAIDALMSALPVSGLEPQWLACLEMIVGLPKDQAWRGDIVLLEPPASRKAPHIEPADAMVKLLLRQGAEPDISQAQAREALTRMRSEVDEESWATFFDDFDSKGRECLPVPDFISWLRDESTAYEDICDFIERSAARAVKETTFSRLDNPDDCWTLENPPVSTPPEAMIEYLPGGPWFDIDRWGDWRRSDNPFSRWREAIRPIVRELEKALGHEVYHFRDPDSEYDDDSAHRFLVLRWCCEYMPSSAFLGWITKRCGAADVEELKTALVDPSSYRQPFRMNDAGEGIETRFCRFQYVAPDRREWPASIT